MRHECGKRSTLVRLREQEPAVARGFSVGVGGVQRALGRCLRVVSWDDMTMRILIQFFFFTPALGDSLQAARPRSPERCQNPRRYTGFALLWRRSVRVFSTVIASVQLTSGLQLVPVFVISLQQSSSFAPTDIYTRPLLPSSIRTNNVPSSRPPPQHQGYFSR